MKFETDNVALRRTIERNESVSDIQKKSIESKSDTIKTLQNQLVCNFYCVLNRTRWERKLYFSNFICVGSI